MNLRLSACLLVGGFLAGILAGAWLWRDRATLSAIISESASEAPSLILPKGRAGNSDVLTLESMVIGARGSRDDLRLAILYGKVNALRIADIDAFLRELARSQDREVRRCRDDLEDALIQRLTEIDLVEAWKLLSTSRIGDTKKSVRRRMDRWVRMVFSRLATEDLVAGQRLVEAMEPNGWVRDQAIEALLEHANASDPIALLAWVKATEPDFTRYGEANNDFTDMQAYMIAPDDGLFARWAKNDLASAKAYVFGLSPGIERNQGLAGIAEALAVTDPAAAVAFAKGLTKGRERNAVWYRTMHLLASTRPADAARLLDEMPDGQTKRVILTGLTEQWLRSSKADALAWVGGLEESPRKQRVLKAAVGHLSQTDPHTAIDLASQLHGVVARQRAVSEVARRWVGDDASAAMAWLKGQPQSGFRDEILRYSLPNYAGQNPEEAWAYFDEVVAKDGMSRALEAGVGPMAYSFAKLDLERALAWAEELPSESAREAALTQAIYAIAGEDPQRAASIVDGGQVKSKEGVVHVAKTFAKVDAAGAFGWIATQAPEQRWTATAHALGGLTFVDPQAAAEQLEDSARFLEPDEWQRLDNQAEAITNVWARTDLRAALTWANELPPGDVQDAAMKPVVSNWVEDDPFSASAWISQLEDSALKQNASRQLADAIRDEDPEAAFLWSQTLHEGFRPRMMAEAIRTWGEVDRDAALRAVEEAHLSTTDRERLLKTFK